MRRRKLSGYIYNLILFLVCFCSCIQTIGYGEVLDKTAVRQINVFCEQREMKRGENWGSGCSILNTMEVKGLL